MKNFIIAALVSILLGIGGYYYYINYYLQDDSNDESTSVYNTDDLVVAYASEATETENKSEDTELKEYDTSYFDLESVIDEMFPLNGSYDLDEARLNFRNSGIDDITQYCVKENSKNNEKFIDFISETKNKFYNLVSNRTYRISNVDKILSGLLLSYEDLYENEQFAEQKLNSIYKLMNNKDSNLASEYYNDIEKYISPESSEIFENIRFTDGSLFTNGDLVWFYSFWARRNNEGNAEQTVAIIRDVIEHYEPDIRKNSEE